MIMMIITFSCDDGGKVYFIIIRLFSFHVCVCTKSLFNHNHHNHSFTFKMVKKFFFFGIFHFHIIYKKKYEKIAAKQIQKKTCMANAWEREFISPLFHHDDFVVVVVFSGGRRRRGFFLLPLTLSLIAAFYLIWNDMTIKNSKQHTHHQWVEWKKFFFCLSFFPAASLTQPLYFFSQIFEQQQLYSFFSLFIFIWCVTIVVVVVVTCFSG